jgi:hypothetical protein
MKTMNLLLLALVISLGFGSFAFAEIGGLQPGESLNEHLTVHVSVLGYAEVRFTNEALHLEVMGPAEEKIEVPKQGYQDNKKFFDAFASSRWDLWTNIPVNITMSSSSDTNLDPKYFEYGLNSYFHPRVRWFSPGSSNSVTTTGVGKHGNGTGYFKGDVYLGCTFDDTFTWYDLPAGEYEDTIMLTVEAITT